MNSASVGFFSSRDSEIFICKIELAGGILGHPLDRELFSTSRFLQQADHMKTHLDTNAEMLPRLRHSFVSFLFGHFPNGFQMSHAWVLFCLA